MRNISQQTGKHTENINTLIAQQEGAEESLGGIQRGSWSRNAKATRPSSVISDCGQSPYQVRSLVQ